MSNHQLSIKIVFIKTLLLQLQTIKCKNFLYNTFITHNSYVKWKYYTNHKSNCLFLFNYYESKVY